MVHAALRAVTHWVSRPVVVALAVLAGVFAVPVAPAEALAAAEPAPPSLTTVAPTVPLPPGATTAGPLATVGRSSVDVVLRISSDAGLAGMARAVSTPGSPEFGHFLKRGAFDRLFGGDPTAVAALRTAAAAQGLTATVAGGLIVTVSGPVGGLERLFHTKLDRVRLADGALGHRSTGPAELTGSLAHSVSGVVGLDDLDPSRPVSLVRAGTTAAAPIGLTSSRAPTTTGPDACAAAQGLHGSAGAETDDALASLYGLDGLYADGTDGVGQTVDVYELDPFAPSDVAAFDRCYFGASAAASMSSRLKVVPVDGGLPSGPGAGEAALDVENVSALAPGARIDVYEAPNTTAGSLDEFSRIVSDDNASVISTSDGLCESAMQLEEPGVQQAEDILFEQAAAQGQTVVAASGDSGSSDCNVAAGTVTKPVLSVDDPASQPYVLAVGGTAVAPGGETAWGSTSGGGGGGGISRSWSAPAWQVDSGVPGVADPTTIAAAKHVLGSKFCAPNPGTCREVPDVSAAADPAAGGVTVFYGGRWTSEGGTSSAAPLWAAMLADTASTSACRPVGRSGDALGFAVPLLYEIAADPGEYAASFHDVTTGSDAVEPGAHGLFPAGVGYDLATGLGTPEFTGPGGTPGLAAALCASATATAPTVARLTPDSVATTIAAGQPATVVTVTGSGFEGSGGTSLVASVSIGDRIVPATAGVRSLVRVISAQRLTVTVPTGAQLNPSGGGAGAYQVTVTLVGGIASRPGARSLLHYVDTAGGRTLPSVDRVGPTGGPQSGGTVVTISGSGFRSAAGVEFGSVPARQVRVVSDDRITAVVPAEDASTVCAGAAGPSADVCQVQVTVLSPDGTSATEPILPPFAGAVTTDPYGAVTAPSGCGCEVSPAATEYDYLTDPVVTSVTALTGADGRQYVSANGHSTIVVSGHGLGILGYQWTDLGTPGLAASVVAGPSGLGYPGLLSISATRLVVDTPAAPPGSVLPLTVPVAVQTLASPNRDDHGASSPPSTGGQVVYASTATVSGVSTASGRSAGPTTGGTQLTITGTGLSEATDIQLVDQVPGAPSFGVTTAFRVVGSTIVVDTPAAAVGRDDVLVCTATGCSNPDPAVDTFTYVRPGDPVLVSNRPLRGPAAGGTVVKLVGSGLGWVVAVRFGSVDATTFANLKGTDDGGDPTRIDVTAPPGRAGTTVPIEVETLAGELDGTGFSAAVPGVTFTYH